MILEKQNNTAKSGGDVVFSSILAGSAVEGHGFSRAAKAR
jgi:hypothetical protein